MTLPSLGDFVFSSSPSFLFTPFTGSSDPSHDHWMVPATMAGRSWPAHLPHTLPSTSLGGEAHPGPTGRPHTSIHWHFEQGHSTQTSSHSSSLTPTAGIHPLHTHPQVRDLESLRFLTPTGKCPSLHLAPPHRAPGPIHCTTMHGTTAIQGSSNHRSCHTETLLGCSCIHQYSK